jgi:hypothetical protein
MIGPVPQTEDDFFGKRRVFDLRGRELTVDYSKKPARISDAQGAELSVARRRCSTGPIGSERIPWAGTCSCGSYTGRAFP